MIELSRMKLAAVAVGLNLAIAGSVVAQGDLSQTQQPQGNQTQTIGTGDMRTFNGINQTPWFANPSMREQLRLDDNQYRQLNDNYGQSWTGYNQGITGLNANLPEQERMQRMEELNGTFHEGFYNSQNTVFTDPEARQRYNQLYLQYRGYGAFNDPAVQTQLNLTPAQRRQFNKADRDWNRQMNTWQRDYQTNPAQVSGRFTNSQKQYQQNVSATLTPAQQQQWNDLIGTRFEFTPDVYFQTSPTPAGNQPQVK